MIVSPAASIIGAEVRCEGLTVGYGGSPVFEQLDLTLPPGAFTAIIGGNGSGKSTLLKSIAGLLRPQGGRVQIDGQSPHDMRGALGYMPQINDVDWRFPITVREVVQMGRYRFRWRRRVRASQIRGDSVNRALERMNVADLANRQIQPTLRRTAQARPDRPAPWPANRVCSSWTNPSAALDVVADDQLLDSLCDIADSGVSVVISTHDLGSVVDHYAHVNLRQLRRLSRRAGGAGARRRRCLTEDVLRRTFGRELAIVSHEYPPAAAAADAIPIADRLRVHPPPDHDHAEGHPHGDEHLRGRSSSD